ncbi:hypothetical protein STEG23_002875, partial [Scotinomys teguina]
SYKSNPVAPSIMKDKVHLVMYEIGIFGVYNKQNKAISQNLSLKEDENEMATTTESSSNIMGLTLEQVDQS